MLILHHGAWMGLPRIAVVGELGVAAVLELIDRHAAATRGRSGAVIIDLSGARAETFHFNEIANLSRELVERGLPGPGVRVAVVAPRPLTYGLCRMLQELADGIASRVAVHASVDDAAGWLRDSVLAAS